MDWFRITHLSIGSISFNIVAGLLLYYLLRNRQKSKNTWLLAGYVFFGILMSLGYIIRYSVLSPLARHYHPAADGIGFGIVCLLFFAYHFPWNLHPLESKIVPFGYLALLIIVYIEDTVKYARKILPFSFSPVTHDYSHRTAVHFSVVLGIGLILTILILLRKTVLLSDYQGRLLAWFEKHRKFRYILGRLFVPVIKIMRPTNKEAWSTRAFTIITVISLAISLSFILSQSAMISDLTFSVLTNYGLLITVLACFVVYTNASPEFSSFRQKLVGVSLATLMVVLGISGTILTSYFDNFYDRERFEQGKILATAINNGESIPGFPLVTYIVVWPEKESAGTYRVLYTSEQKIQSFDFEKSNRLVRENNKYRGISNKGSGGMRGFRFFDLYDPNTFYLHYDFPLGGQIYEIGYPYDHYRDFVHRLGLRLIVINVLAALLLLLIFPWFFHRSITKPLDDLQKGVQEVNRGNLDIQVPVYVADEVGYVAESFNSMVESVKRGDKLKDEFLANTSHELRTPLNGIIGIAESLMDGAMGKLPKAADRNLSMIVSSGKRLTTLVNDILDFSKLKEGEITLQRKPLDIREIAKLVVSISTPFVKDRPVEIEIDIDEQLPLVFGDENRLQQIMHNLIGNAIKFTKRGKITVSAKEITNELSFSMIEIIVQDTGIGIPEDKLEDIFKSFEQGDATTSREYGGTGLGLSITKKLIELHGGTIRVESDLGVGSKFIFTVPTSEEQVKAQPEDVQTISSLLYSSGPQISIPQTQALDGDINILVVDDEPINVQVLANHLSLASYQIIQAEDGFKALEIIDSGKKLDLILLDIMMPRMNGYEVCQKIRERYPANELPIIMLTAKNQVSDLVEGLYSGANDYISKPFSKNELLARIKTQVQLAKLNLSYRRFIPREFFDILEKESVLDVRLGDQIQKDMTIMFSDIRSFTVLSEKMTPEENFEFINTYLGRVVPHIRDQNGFIDKYIGDAIMALFPNIADSAVTAAIEMQKEISLFNKDREVQKKIPIQIGIGIHTGKLILGTVGEEQRMDETVISDAVNLASRVEGLTKLYNASILISESTLSQFEDADKFNKRFLGKVKVKGKDQSTSVFEICDGDPTELRKLKIESKNEFEYGLKLYYQRQFAEASVVFNNIVKANPLDKAATLYRERAARFIVHEPPEQWDGVEKLETK